MAPNRFTSLISLMAVMLLALLAQAGTAKAHGSEHESAARVTAASAGASDNAAAAVYFEAAPAVDGQPCNGVCCCTGPSHCAPCGPSASALDGAEGHLGFYPMWKRVRPFYAASLDALDRKFGLERPPRA